MKLKKDENQFQFLVILWLNFISTTSLIVQLFTCELQTFHLEENLFLSNCPALLLKLTENFWKNFIKMDQFSKIKNFHHQDYPLNLFSNNIHNE